MSHFPYEDEHVDDGVEQSLERSPSFGKPKQAYPPHPRASMGDAELLPPPTHRSAIIFPDEDEEEEEDNYNNEIDERNFLQEDQQQMLHYPGPSTPYYEGELAGADDLPMGPTEDYYYEESQQQEHHHHYGPYARYGESNINENPNDEYIRYVFPEDGDGGNPRQAHPPQQQYQVENYEEEPQDSPTLLGRCAPLNLEFMWRRFHKARARSGVNDDLLSRDRLESMQQEQGFPTGLARSILLHAMHCPIRFWIVDNSGTMHSSDGHRVVRTNSARGKLNRKQRLNIQVVDCTRWEEVQSTVLWHAELAAWCQTPLAMRLVHDPGATVGSQQVGVSASKTLSCIQEVDRLRRLLRSTRPSGGTTPLTRHLQDILSTLEEFYPRLSYHRHPPKARSHDTPNTNYDDWLTLVICTDSLPTDEEGQENHHVVERFVKTLASLKALGVSVVVRLSTDEERVVDFYRSLDINANNLPMIQRRLSYQTKGGLSRLVSTARQDHGVQPRQPPGKAQSRYGAPRHLSVLDDYVSECHEIFKHNPWLHYGYPLHLCREQGITSSVLEALSRRPLKPTEVCELIQLVFDCELPGASLGADDNSRSPNGRGNRRPSVPNEVPRIGTDYEGNRQEPQRQEQPASTPDSADYGVFRANLEWYNKQSGLLWNPVKQKFVPWVDLKKLDQLYGNKQVGSGGNKKGTCTIS